MEDDKKNLSSEINTTIITRNIFYMVLVENENVIKNLLFYIKEICIQLMQNY